jgi:hypothetical protein
MEFLMEDKKTNDSKAAEDSFELLLNVLPKSEAGIHNIAYTFGLICRETGIQLEKATESIMSWGERLRTIQNFLELYPRYRKPSFYRYQVRYAVQSAYKRTQDKPSSYWFEALTGKKAPAASFWDDRQPLKKRGRPRKKTTE